MLSILKRKLKGIKKKNTEKKRNKKQIKKKLKLSFNHRPRKRMTGMSLLIFLWKNERKNKLLKNCWYSLRQYRCLTKGSAQAQHVSRKTELFIGPKGSVPSDYGNSRTHELRLLLHLVPCFLFSMDWALTRLFIIVMPKVTAVPSCARLPDIRFNLWK